MEDLWQLTNPIIAFRNVSKVFEDSGTQVLKDINFELEEGKFYTYLGLLVLVNQQFWTSLQVS